MEAITFEQLPQAVSRLAAKLDKIEQLLERQALPVREEPDELLGVDKACALLQLAKPTVYGLVSHGKLPYMKQGKKLYFMKRELLEWLKQGRKGEREGLESAVDRALATVKRKKR